MDKIKIKKCKITLNLGNWQDDTTRWWDFECCLKAGHKGKHKAVDDNWEMKWIK